MNPIQKAIYLDVFGDPSLNSQRELTANRAIVDDALTMSGGADTLRALYREGPLGDGDVPSKVQRDALINNGYCVKVVVGGADGYNACTHKGAWLSRCLDSLYKRFDQSEALHPDAPATEAPSPLVTGRSFGVGDPVFTRGGMVWPIRMKEPGDN